MSHFVVVLVSRSDEPYCDTEHCDSLPLKVINKGHQRADIVKVNVRADELLLVRKRKLSLMHYDVL